METLDLMTDFYNNYDEDSRLRTKPGSVEYRTTMHYIEKYLRPDMHILEIGTATGRYAHALARKGCVVDAVELVRRNIEIFIENTQEGEQISIRQGDARDLSDFADETYDMTLLLGPMYQLTR